MNTTMKTLAAALFAITGFVVTAQPAAASGWGVGASYGGGWGTYGGWNYRPSSNPTVGTGYAPNGGVSFTAGGAPTWGGGPAIPVYRVYGRTMAK